MLELDAPCVEAERRIVHAQGLRVAELFAADIRGVAADGITQMPEVNADLIGASRHRNNFYHRVIFCYFQNSKLRLRRFRPGTCEASSLM